jgi:hypothetical protein
MRDQTCRRCGTPAPPEGSGAFVRWTSARDSPRELYCPQCLTPGEEEALAKIAAQLEEDQLLLDRLPGARKNVFVPKQRTAGSAPVPTDHPVSKA